MPLPPGADEFSPPVGAPFPEGIVVLGVPGPAGEGGGGSLNGISNPSAGILEGVHGGELRFSDENGAVTLQSAGGSGVALVDPSGGEIQVKGDGTVWIHATDEDIVVEVGGGGEFIVGGTAGDNPANMKLRVNGRGVGFYGNDAIDQPTVSATPNAQDVVDALVALGLVTQAS